MLPRCSILGKRTQTPSPQCETSASEMLPQYPLVGICVPKMGDIPDQCVVSGIVGYPALCTIAFREGVTLMHRLTRRREAAPGPLPHSVPGHGSACSAP